MYLNDEIRFRRTAIHNVHFGIGTGDVRNQDRVHLVLPQFIGTYP